MSKERAAFQQTGTQLIAIFCQKAEPVRQWAQTNDIPFTMLIDEDRSVAKQYGVYVSISYDAFNMARPANFLIDQQGLIKFLYVSSHQWDRAATSALLAEASK